MDKTLKVGKWSVLIGFLLIVFLLYFPVLNRGFVSDDFTVLFRLIYSGDFTPPGFFRPGADFSLYSTYLLSGLNPAAYNISNLVIHVLNAWLLFLICRQFFFLRSEALTSVLPVIASFIFLIYPFHQEPIVWVLGRGILLSSFFALLSVYVLFIKKNFRLVIVSSAILYFLSLLCYESSVFLPVVALLILKSRGMERRKFYWVILFFSVAFLAHLVVRNYFAGSMIGAYGKDFDAFKPGQYAYEYLKFWFRIVMVPVSNVYLFLSGAFVLLGALIYAGFKISNRDQQSKNLIKGLVLIIFLSFFIPAFFGITIRTTEGDRFLYFPSIFFSVFLGLVFISGRKSLVYSLSLYAIVSIILIIENNRGWLESSQKVESIVGAVKRNSAYRVIIYNLPGSKNGKYIFRNGFKEALLLNNIDTTGIYVNNMQEEVVNSMSYSAELPIAKNEKGIYQLKNDVPFNLKPPFCIINVTNQKIQVFQVGYSTPR